MKVLECIDRLVTR